MLTEYVCAVKNGHRQSCGAPQTPPPECCGKPMLLLQTAPQTAAAAQSVADAPAGSQETPTSKPPAPQRARKGSFKR